MPRAPSDAQFNLPAHFAHTLLPARDWQDRPEFAQLCDWWRGSSNAELGMRNAESIKTGPRSAPHAPRSPGVCALVGIGGAGKTAIAERFLRGLPGGLPALRRTPKDESLLSPRALFVFSFYDAPNPDSFFAEVSAWLGGFHEPCSSRREEAHSSQSGNQSLLTSTATAEGNAAHVSYQQTLQLLSRVAQTAVAEESSADSAGPHSPLVTRHSPLLLVLDGLEKVQDDGARGGAFGQLLDGRLRDLILRAADGYLAGVAFLITTRFRLFDPLAQRSAFYRQIDIDQLQAPAALALLRARGVHATDAQLLALAHESGFHAFTLDLLGGYVAAFCDGDPSHLPPLAEVKVPDEAAAEDPRLAAVKEQERKFGRLAQRYREALATRDPAALALMERICLFRLGVNADTLAVIFTGAGKETVSGPALAVLNREQVERKLRLLAQMRLLVRSESRWSFNATASQPVEDYTVHPAVRDGFLRYLGKDASDESHTAVHQFLAGQLSGIPSNRFATEPRVLDLMEEAVHHATAAGRVKEASEVYEHRLHGFANLGDCLAQYDRGHRLCVTLLAGCRKTGLQGDLWERATHDLALYRRELGFLGAAHELLQGARQRMIGSGKSRRFTNFVLHEEAEVLTLQGFLIRALTITDEVAHRSDWDMWRAGAEPSSWVRLLQQRVTVCGLLGRTAEACHLLQQLEQHAGRGGWDYLHRLSAGDPLAASRFLALAGASTKAEQLARDAIRRLTRPEFQFRTAEVPRFKLVIADLSRDQGKSAEAQQLQLEAYEWAIAHDAKEVLCWSALVRARIQIADAGAQRSVPEKTPSLVEARKSLDEGLHIARDCGYCIYHIDLLLERARLHLLRGEPQAALDDLRVALDDGHKPPPDSGFPTVLAATHPECGYAWGIAEGRHLRAQAVLLQAAQTLGRPDFAPANFRALPTEVRSLIQSARKELEECRLLKGRIRDPKVRDTVQVLMSLKEGHLTPYPLQPPPPVLSRESEVTAQTMKAKSSTVADLKGRVHVAIITIRQDEYDEMEAKLAPTTSVQGGNNSYELATIQTVGDSSVMTVLTRVVAQGNVNAQAVANNVIQDLDPAWLFLVGIAGGVPDNDYSLGDVVLANYLADFSVSASVEGGERTYQVAGGPMHQEVDRFLQTKIGGKNKKTLLALGGFLKDQMLLNHPPVYRSSKLQSSLFYGSRECREATATALKSRFPRGKRNGGPVICAGCCANANTLLKDPQMLKEWQKSARQVSHIEMELVGVYSAARSAGRRNYPVLAIRGLSDIIGFKRDPRWTAYACKTAAAMAHAILRSGFIDFEASLPKH